MKKFSIILPVWNNFNYKLTVESVLQQNYQDFELILIDDGSDKYFVKDLSDTLENKFDIKLNSGNDD